MLFIREVNTLALFRHNGQLKTLAVTFQAHQPSSTMLTSSPLLEGAKPSASAYPTTLLRQRPSDYRRPRTIAHLALASRALRENV